ncbi:MAG TPA: DUF4105 domain-containing protein [Chitinophagales bacterium]|nr:DUF4105 domain-containing protein [Chitinophagales bacterium]
MKLINSKLCLLLFIFFIGQVIHANEREVKVADLTSSAKVSLLTVGRADHEIWQNFGHTAIRVKDSILGWDLVYNYGTFNFGAPDFMYNFIKGRLLYYESIDNFKDFEQAYREENRSINEQLLNLSQEQKQLIFERLTINAREEYKYYKYDFLYDNCSTRPRNVLFSLFKKVEYAKDKDDDASFRQLIDRNVPNEWLDFGMDLLIGVPTDKKADYGRTFLPDELMQLCDSAIVDGKPLVISNELILDVIPEYTEKNYITPSLIFWIVFIIVLLLQMKFSFFSRYKIIPVLYFSILGCLGWLFIFMWFFTEHLSTKWNLNILWAMPLNIPLMLFVFREKLPRLVMSYIKFYRILLIMLLIAWWPNPQTYHNAVVPLILLAILFTSLFLQVPTKEDFKKRLFG